MEDIPTLEPCIIQHLTPGIEGKLVKNPWKATGNIRQNMTIYENPAEITPRPTGCVLSTNTKPKTVPGYLGTVGKLIMTPSHASGSFLSSNTSKFGLIFPKWKCFSSLFWPLHLLCFFFSLKETKKMFFWGEGNTRCCFSQHFTLFLGERGRQCCCFSWGIACYSGGKRGEKKGVKLLLL